MMSNEVMLYTGQHSLAAISGQVKEFINASRAESTKAAYRKDWEDFSRWCKAAELPSMPATPETVAAYLSHLATEGKSASTLTRRASAIRFAHKLAGVQSPTASPLVEATMGGIRRTIGTAQHGKAPAVAEDVKAMCACLSDTLKGKRDRALLLVGFAGAFRRSELAALTLEDMEFCREGLKIHLRRSKTDQEGEGQVKGIPYGRNTDSCPVTALQEWLEASGITSGLILRSVNKWGQIGGGISDKDVARVVKYAASLAGFDAARYSGHSLRAGLATSAAAAGVSERIIMQQTGHKSERMVRKYIREGNIFRENAAGLVGL